MLVTDYSLNQFGAVLTFAIDLEELVSEYYNSIQSISDKTLTESEVTNRINAASKRKRNLERSRRENVTEITLEPIEGLDAQNYTISGLSYDKEGMVSLHKIASGFYEDAMEKLNVLETKRLFSRHHKEHSRLQKTVEA